jgi:hypothetical protein
MPSHAPLCGINRPHARYWSRTNRIDPILELPPVTSDTVAVPPPTRSPEPKVTRYIVIRNDQHDGSSHQGKIFIVAGNRAAAARLPGKATITFRNHSAYPDLVTPSRTPVSHSPPRKIFLARSAGTPHSPKCALANRPHRPAQRGRTGSPSDPAFEPPPTVPARQHLAGSTWLTAPGRPGRHRLPAHSTGHLDLLRLIPINPRQPNVAAIPRV